MLPRLLLLCCCYCCCYAVDPTNATTTASSGRRVAIVMMDNRDPDLAAWLDQHRRNVLSLEVQARLVTILTSYLNMRYACRHGYTLLFYKLRRPGCMHPLWGARHPSYCKLTAIGEALHSGFAWVVYLDSDAFIRGREALPTLLTRYGGVLSGPRAAEALFGWDHPFTLGPNMGFIALRNTPTVRELVRVWWNGYAGAYSLEHPFEQHSLQWQVMHLDRFSRIVQTLSLRTMDPTYPDGVVHLDHNAGTKTRIWIMAGSAAEMLAADGNAGASPPQLRKHLQIFAQQRKGIDKKWRRPAIEAVLKAARADLRSGPGRACTRLVVPFNASASAMERLWKPPPAFHGASPRGNVAAAAPEQPVQEAAAGGGAAAATAAADVLAGMPLQLVNCSNAPGLHTPWQQWTLTTEALSPKIGAKGVAERCTGLCLAHRFSLRAAPSLCMSLGRTRTPRNPFQMQAQLAPCPNAPTASAHTFTSTAAAAAASNEPSGAAAIRSRLHFSAKAGTIKATHRTYDFRANLPEHRTTCGFWPACSGTRLLLPKPCWGRLHANLTACGEEEERVNNFLIRERRLPEAERTLERTGFVIGNDGPLPPAMVNTSGKDRLCLTAWRGMSIESAAVVFLRCPQGRGRKWRSSALFEWLAVAAASPVVATPTPVEPPSIASAPQLVRIVPRSAPGLCLAAPMIATPHLAHEARAPLFSLAADPALAKER